MDMMDGVFTITVASLVTLLNFGMAVITFFHNRRKDANSERQQSEDRVSQQIRENDEKDKANLEFQVKTQTKLDQIYSTTSEIRSDIRTMDNKVQEVDKRLFSAERSIESLTDRVTNLENDK